MRVTMSFVLPEGRGIARLTRFERVQLIGTLILHYNERKQAVTPAEVEAMVDGGGLSFLIRRNYCDNTSALFRVLENNRLEQVLE